MLIILRYPSLLQSSDLDGGSSVAVLTYLCRILDSVDHPDIIHLILHYLLALPGPVSSRPVTPRSPDAQRQKKSLKEHESPDATEEVMNPSFFNLTDLLLASCQSRNPETVTAALRLVCVILSKYHDYALSSLLKMVMFEDSFTSRPPGLVLGELDTLLAIAADSAGMEGLNEAYENSIRDSLALLEAHPCSADLFGISELRGGMIASKGAIMDDKHPTMCMHSLSAEDPLLKQLVTLLRTFFTNDIETNLSLTSAIRYLALCPFVRLSGWLCTETTISSQLSEPEPSTAPSSDPESRTQDNLDPDAQELTRIREYKASLRQSSTDVSTTPLIQALHHLTHTLVALRHDIPEFAHLLAGRKRAFQGLAELEDEALNQRRTAPTSAQPVMASPRASVEQSREQSRSRPLPIPTLSPSPSGQAAAAQQRSISPRGRTMSILAGQGSPRSLGSTSSPRQLQSPVSFGSPPSFGARPSFRPQLREEMQRRQSRSPVKVSRAMSPLAAVDGASMGSPRSGRSISPTESPPVQQLEQAGSMDQEIFDRWIRFSWEGEYDAERNKGRRTDVSADEHNRGKSGGDKGDTDGDTGDYREASLTHVLTNAVILQEFVLELAAIIHVRAGLLNGEMSSEGNTA